MQRQRRAVITVIATVAVAMMAAGVVSSGAVSQALGRRAANIDVSIPPLARQAAVAAAPVVDVSVTVVRRGATARATAKARSTNDVAGAAPASGAPSASPVGTGPDIVCAAVPTLDPAGLVPAITPPLPAVSQLPPVCPEQPQTQA